VFMYIHIKNPSSHRIHIGKFTIIEMADLYGKICKVPICHGLWEVIEKEALIRWQTNLETSSKHPAVSLDVLHASLTTSVPRG